MSSALHLAKSGLQAFIAVKEATTAVMHPAQWAKDRLAQAALDRLNVVGKTLPFSFDVPVPSQATGLLEGDGLQLARDVANEALAGPLELLGYRLGRLDVHYLAEEQRLVVEFEAGLMPAGAAAAGEPARLS